MRVPLNEILRIVVIVVAEWIWILGAVKDGYFTVEIYEKSLTIYFCFNCLGVGKYFGKNFFLIQMKELSESFLGFFFLVVS